MPGGVYQNSCFSIHHPGVCPSGVYPNLCFGIHHPGPIHHYRLRFCTLFAPPFLLVGVCRRGHPEVDRHFDTEEVGDGAESKKQRAEQQNLRHRLWRKRGRSNAESWRPRKRFRVSSAKFLRVLDRQVQLSTSFDGLNHFRPGDGGCWRTWRTMPHLTIVSDQGSDCISALFAAALHPELSLNVTCMWDPCHGAHRDVMKMWRDAGLFSFVLLALMAMNLPHGPDETDMRFMQVRQAMKECFDVHRASSCELFLGLVPELASSLASEVEVGESESLEDALWRWLSNLSYFARKGHNTNLNRFMGFAKDSTTFVRHWWAACFQAEYTALELDMLGSSQLRKRIQAKPTGGDPAALPSTGGAARTVDDRTLKSCCQNSLVVAVMFLSEASNFRALCMGTAAAQPVLAWHTEQSRLNRDVHTSCEWMRSQVESKFMEQVCQVYLVLENEEALKQCGFLEVGAAGSRVAQPSEAQCFVEDDAAELFGAFCWMLATARQTRTLWMTSQWPVACCRFLSGGREAEEAVAEFRKDYEIFEALRSRSVQDSLTRAVIERSPFVLHSVRQVAMALAESQWVLAPDVLSMIRKRFSCIVSTQAVEDVNNIQKNEKASRTKSAAPRFRTPQTSMAAALKKNVVGTMHKYTPMATDQPVPGRATVLVRDNFFADRKHESQKFGALVTTSQKAAHFSPGPGDIGKPAADMAMLREAHDTGNLLNLSDCVCVFFAEVEHKVCFKVAEDGVDKWFVGLHHFADSAALVMPVELESVPGYPNETWVRPKPRARPVLKPIFTLDGMQAFTFSFFSWATQVRKFPRARTLWRPAIRAFKCEDASEILVVAARAGWWSLGKAALCKIGQHIGHPQSSSASLFDVLFNLTKAVLEAGDVEVLDCLKGRLRCTRDEGMKVTDDLLQMDEATACLDFQDQREIKKQQQSVKDRRVDAAAFSGAYREARVRLRSSQPPNTRAGKQKPRGQRSYKGPNRMPPLSAISHETGKALMPPGSFLWRHNSQGTWNSRAPPMSTCSRSWRKYSEPVALALCIQQAWRDYLLLEGTPEQDCPVQELLDRDFLESGLLPGASSSAGSTT